MNRKRWTEEETKRFKKIYSTTSQEELSVIFERSVSSLESRASKLGLKKLVNNVGKRIFTKREIKKIFNMVKIKSVPEIAKELNREKESIYILLKRNNVEYLKSDFWWSELDTQVLIDYYEGSSKEFLEKKLDKKWKTISKKARTLGLKRYRSNGEVYVANDLITEEERTFILENFENMTITQMAHTINRTCYLVVKVCRDNNLSEFKMRKNPEDFTNEFLLEKLKELGKEFGRCPTTGEIQKSRDLPSIDTYYDRFGTFSNACEMAGFVFNSGTYGIGCYSKNGDKCLSIREQIITNFLIDNRVAYEKEKYYHEIIDTLNENIVMDWYLEDFHTVVEFFGLNNKEYNKKTKRKIKLCKNNEINIIAIYEKDMSKLGEIFKNYIK